MIKNIGILGASSFIGQELIKQLALKNFNIYIFSRKKNKIKIQAQKIFLLYEDNLIKKI